MILQQRQAMMMMQQAQVKAQAAAKLRPETQPSSGSQGSNAQPEEEQP